MGVHQGSILSPLLFILVLEALSSEFRTVVPWELLYANDLVSYCRHSGRVCVKAQVMEGGHGEQRAESQHEED